MRYIVLGLMALLGALPVLAAVRHGDSTPSFKTQSLIGKGFPVSLAGVLQKTEDDDDDDDDKDDDDDDKEDDDDDDDKDKDDEDEDDRGR